MAERKQIKNKKLGVGVQRYFSEEGKSVYDSREWVEGTAKFGDFEQENVRYPLGWSPLAVGTVASKYFFGDLKTSERESSVSDLIDRVSSKFSEWGMNQEYFANEAQAELFKDEIASLTLNQQMAFNSPVWFNTGVDRYAVKKKGERKSSFVINDSGKAVRISKGKEYEYPQSSACFIQGVEDTMEGIMQLTTNEAMLFKYGSGTGTDLSSLRSSFEKLSGGGKPSGPMAYLKYMSRVAGIVRSGGKTRRAAKMDSLRVTHPDIKEFIEAKTLEKKKAESLISEGYSANEAIETVAYQNANLSVRATDDFMNAVLNDEEWQTFPVHNTELADKMPKYKAKNLMELIATGTAICGDPGMQFHDTINKWHTCPNSAPINASNPCSEYMFVDDSSCNLASLNLLSFLKDDGVFDYISFGEAAKKTAIAQDLEIDNSSYPNKKIAENSHKFRPLGQGYANLGALLMTLGLPYDSEEGRAVAATITAYQTSKVYEMSTELAEKISPFDEFEKNKEPMLNVISMHKAALDKIDKTKLPSGLEGVLDEAFNTWDNVLERGKKYGFRNAQATVLAPTGTIGFMMDCDTTGIEPDFSLVKTKQLFDGGILTIVNQSVEPALEKIGYDRGEIKDILNYIEKQKTIEGSGIKDEHLSIFDCANKCGNGERFIDSMGHINMMAAVQPFLSGAISKTVNLPSDTNAQDIENIYMASWKKGVKAVAIYRDGSHVLQPLTSEKGLEKTLDAHPVAIRRKLPGDRPATIHKFNIAGHEGYLTMGEYPGEGMLGETFIDMSKEGSTIGGLMDVIATQTSMLLQHGVPLETLVGKFKGQKFDPRGLVLEGDSEIKKADSIIDYIFSHLGNCYLTKKGGENSSKTIDNGFDDMDDQLNPDNYDWDNIPSEEKGSDCPICSHAMRKIGYCSEICLCGHKNTNGCGE